MQMKETAQVVTKPSPVWLYWVSAQATVIVQSGLASSAPSWVQEKLQ